MADGSHHVFRFNEEALGRDNIKLAVVEENDDLSFVKSSDTVVSRTFNGALIEKIKKTGARNTAEKHSTYVLIRDKIALSNFLRENGILVPNSYTIEQVSNGKNYFVKPRFGQDSFGITLDCICQSKCEVVNQVKRIGRELHQDSIIEDFIDGVECTVACVANGHEVKTYVLEVDCSKSGGIQTYQSKENYEEYCSALHDTELEKIALNIFSILGLRHHARMDFRCDSKGNYYLIDINLLPGLGPLGDYAKCLLLSGNLSYIDAMKSIVNSASID